MNIVKLSAGIGNFHKTLTAIRNSGRVFAAGNYIDTVKARAPRLVRVEQAGGFIKVTLSIQAKEQAK